ncbi:MAG: hypothetical protein M1478_04545 [Deltaproteobacteria bacterium]|nr:hypothetical protein [Deltaproteobacteria bacterium]MCL5880084.1 hypothetical protein [Deltaproteobacteria bacterium]
MKNKINYLKENRVNIISIFIIGFILYYYFIKNYNDALGYIVLGIAINIVDLAHKHFKAKENKGADKQN